MKSGSLAAGFGLAAMLAAMPLRAADVRTADCWTEAQAAAAHVRDLQSKLMVATMQCHAIGVDIAPAYNAFVRTNRAGLESVNGAIKARFAGLFGGTAQTHYDRFTTSLANAYGGDRIDPVVCRAMRASAGEAEAIGGDPVKLFELAGRMGVSPRLPGGRCPAAMPVVTLASARPVRTETPAIIASATVMPAIVPAALVPPVTIHVAAVRTAALRLDAPKSPAPVPAFVPPAPDGPRFELVKTAARVVDGPRVEAPRGASAPRTRPVPLLAGLPGDVAK